MSKKILVIYTGGTIGMVDSDQGYVPAAGFEDLMRAQLTDVSDIPDFDVLEYENLIDSSNLEPKHWMAIAKSIECDYNGYDGFVVLHGTDTMAYTASALSFMFQGLRKPIIITGSQIPLSKSRTDAKNNLIMALNFSANSAINEVCLYFNEKLLRGNRSSKVDSTAFSAFDSPNFSCLAEVGIYTHLNTTKRLPVKTDTIRIPQFNPKAVAIIPFYPGFQLRVLESLLEDPELKGVVLQSYGVGNPPDAIPGLLDCLEKASERGVVFVNVSHCLSGAVHQGAYATGAKLNSIGVVSGCDLTLEAAFAKLHFLIAIKSTPVKVREDMLKSIAGEIEQ